MIDKLGSHTLEMAVVVKMNWQNLNNWEFWTTNQTPRHHVVLLQVDMPV